MTGKILVTTSNKDDFVKYIVTLQLLFLLLVHLDVVVRQLSKSVEGK